METLSPRLPILFLAADARVILNAGSEGSILIRLAGNPLLDPALRSG